MKKLRLDLDHIEVVSFSPETGARSRGTAHGFQDTFVSNPNCIPDGNSVIPCEGGTLDCHTIGYQPCPRELNPSTPQPC